MAAELMTLEEVASYLRVNERTVGRLQVESNLPAMKIGHQWRFKKSAIDDWLMQQSVGLKANVLVIDDDEAICALFKTSLEIEGHKVTTTQNPEKGLELVNNNNFDIVFVDLLMPSMNGAVLFKNIRLNKPDLPVTIITGYPDSELMQLAMASGPFSIMKKPFTSSDVLTAVSSYLRFSKNSK
jgi:excisionase family DNA binding protein